jgi:hypothetical protein
MKSVLHPDGVRRITMKIEAAVDVADLTVYALHTLKNEVDPINLIKNCNKREIFALARASLQSYGQDTARVEVTALLNPIQIQSAEEYVRSIYPEID